MATGRKNGHPDRSFRNRPLGCKRLGQSQSPGRQKTDRFLSRKNRLGQTAFWQTVGAIAIAKRNVDYL